MFYALMSFIVALSSGVWIYSHQMRSTGNNTQSSLIGAGVAATVIFIVSFFVLVTIL